MEQGNETGVTSKKVFRERDQARKPESTRLNTRSYNAKPSVERLHGKPYLFSRRSVKRFAATKNSARK